MYFAYLHASDEYFVLIMLLLAAVCFGMPALGGKLYYRWRNRKSARHPDTPLGIKK
jgi:hypothetical protein